MTGDGGVAGDPNVVALDLRVHCGVGFQCEDATICC